MEVVLPVSPLDSKIAASHNQDDGYDDFFTAKLGFLIHNSDLNVYQLMGDARIDHLVLAWNAVHPVLLMLERDILPENLQSCITNLVHYTMDLWFSIEWGHCDDSRRISLLVAMFSTRNILQRIPSLSVLNWQYIMSIGLDPWQTSYYQEFGKGKGVMDTENAPTHRSSVESEETPPPLQELENLEQEDFVIIALRLIKMFDASCMDAVKSLSMRVVYIWNYKKRLWPDLTPVSVDVKRCLNFICHIHLMAVFDRDNASGFEIDNIVYSIYFYYKCMRDTKATPETISEKLSKLEKYTAAQLIASTCIQLDQSVGEFMELGIKDFLRETCSTLFGAISHAYATYALGNLIMLMNKLSKSDFVQSLDKFRRTLNLYIEERERSELFMLDQVHKERQLVTSHNVTCTVKDMSNYSAAICKGNRTNNIISHKPSEVQGETVRDELFEVDNEKRNDPVFETMPNNEVVTNEFYNMLSNRKYKGWQFAKLVLLLKIIGREINDIEKWFYHPGLSTDFIIGLEVKLAKRFEDLAYVFQDHIFMEQELWLTAMYLSPNARTYEKVIYCGTRYYRTVNLLNKGDRNEIKLRSTEKGADKDKDVEISCAFMNAKYGLLSSTFDVKQIAMMTEMNTAEDQYATLAKALRLLRLPETIVKDLLTATFALRHKHFTWAADWPILRKRCKMLYTNSDYKRSLVELNMADASKRLKYLKVEYDRYRNLPQLDYGCIEEGYENDYLGDSEDESSDDDDVDNATLKTNSATKREPHTKSDSDPSDVEQQNIFGSLRRYSARRAAAIIAPRISDSNKSKNENVPCIEKPSTSQPTNTDDESTKPKYTLLHTNTTPQFVSIHEVWTYDKQAPNKYNMWERKNDLISTFVKMQSLRFENKDEDTSSDDSETDDESGPFSNGTMNVSENETNASDNDDCLPTLTREKTANATHDLKLEQAKQGYAEKHHENLIPVTKEAICKDLNIAIEETCCSPEVEKCASLSEIKSVSPVDNEAMTSQTTEKIVDETEKSSIISAILAVDSRPKSPDIKISESLEQSVPPKIDTLPLHRDASATNFTKIVEKENDTTPLNLNAERFEKAFVDIQDNISAKIVEKEKQNSNIVEKENLNANIVDEETVNAEIVQKENLNDSILEKETPKANIAEEENLDTKTIEKETLKADIVEDENKNANIVENENKNANIVENENTNANIVDEENLKANFVEGSGTKIICEVETEEEEGTVNSSESICNKIEADRRIENFVSQSTSESNSRGDVIDTDTGQDSNDINAVLERNVRESMRKAKLSEECLHRKCFVRLEKLRLKSTHLNPRVLIKRMNIDKYLENDAKRRRKARSRSKPTYFYSEESSSPAPTTTTTAVRPRKRPYKPRQSSNESEEEYSPAPTKRRSRLSKSRSPVPIAKKLITKKFKRSRTKSFSIVPRSASGLKMCISSLKDRSNPECIEISSSSDEEKDVIPTFKRYDMETTFQNLCRDVSDENDPLFEEEADFSLLS